MTVRVFIKRHIKVDREAGALAMLLDFRTQAGREPGYLSGETLVNRYDSRSVMVVSSWQKLQDWIRWQSSDQRAANEAKIESLLDLPTKYEIYEVSGPAE
jgi:heme-degrading monooxygenase HmoA